MRISRAIPPPPPPSLPPPPLIALKSMRVSIRLKSRAPSAKFARDFFLSVGANFPSKFALISLVFAMMTAQSSAISEENGQILLLVFNCGKKKCATKIKKHWFWVNDIILILSNVFPCTGA